MGRNVSVSFRDVDDDVFEWVEDMHENGPYRSRSHVIVEALKEKMERAGDDEVLT